MPPPMRRRSAVPRRLPMTPSLSDTFAPPRTTAYGRSGSEVRRRRTSTSVDTRSPVACGSRRATSKTDACLRCTTPKPSETKTSASEASAWANSARSSSVWAVSPGLNRRFSSRTTSPGPAAATVDWADSPTVSVAKATSRPSSSPSRFATGASEYLSSGAPLGRPRWAQTTTVAPASARASIAGTDALMRPSSVIVWPSSGTLRSARTSTRLPRRSPSARRSARVRTDLQVLADEHDDVDEAVGVSPLVVVPADDLDLVADDLGQARVEDARVRVGDDVAADDRVLGVLEDALERAVRRRLDRRVDLVDGRLAAGLEGEVGGRARGDRHAHGEPVELALELRQDQADRLGGAGGRRHD